MRRFFTSHRLIDHAEKKTPAAPTAETGVVASSSEAMAGGTLVAVSETPFQTVPTSRGYETSSGTSVMSSVRTTGSATVAVHIPNDFDMDRCGFYFIALFVHSFSTIGELQSSLKKNGT